MIAAALIAILTSNEARGIMLTRYALNIAL
jgi:hypothetical protein